MKRILSIIVATFAFYAIMAQSNNPMVTLSHNGELSFFTNVGAFKSAVDSAKNGDIIYLSQGNFVIDGGSITINKRLSIVGNGYGSHLLGNININLSEAYSMDAPLFDGVRLDVLDFPGSPLRLGESEIRRCWIRSLNDGADAGTDVLYDKCFIEKAVFYGSGNVSVENSKLVKVLSGYHILKAINCNMGLSDYYPTNAVSCILTYKGSNSSPSDNGTCSIINSVLNFTENSSNVYMHDCYTVDNSDLLDDNMECTIDLESAGYLGEDGTVVGIYGGEDPFSENPSVPTVDTGKSTVEYDADSNKLKVSITVKAD